MIAKTIKTLFRSDFTPPGYSRVFWISVLTGFIGVLTGFALFVRLVHHETTAAKLLAVLAVLALLSFAFEYLRNQIDKSEHHLTLSGVFTTLIILAVFELFAAAAHVAMDLEPDVWQQIGTAIVGPEIAARHITPRWNLVAMAGLWIAIGMAITIALGRAIWIDDDVNRASPPLVGLLTGAIVAPSLAFLYIVGVRMFVELQWAISKPDEWAMHVDAVREFMMLPGIYGIPLRALKGLTSIAGGWGAILGLVAVAMAFMMALDKRSDGSGKWLFIGVVGLSAYIVPLGGVSVATNIKALLSLMGLMVVIWGFPSLLLGAMAPYLNRDGATKMSWSLISWAAAAVLMGFWIALHSAWYLLAAGLLAAAGIAVAKGVALKLYWPVIPLCVATFVVGITQIIWLANFLYVQNLSFTLIQDPLNKLSSRYTAKVIPLPPLTLSGSQELRSLIQGLRQFELEGKSSAAQTPQTAPANDVSTVSRAVGDSLQEVAAVLEERARVATEVPNHLKAISDLMDSHHRLEILEKEPELSTHSKTLVGKVDSLLTKIQAVGRQASAAKEKYDALAGDRFIRRIQAPRLTGLFTDRPAGSALHQPLPSFTYDLEEIRLRGLEGRVKILSSENQKVQEAAKALSAGREKIKEHQLKLTEKAEDARADMARTFELCVTGALGFWASLGMLATWAIRTG